MNYQQSTQMDALSKLVDFEENQIKTVLVDSQAHVTLLYEKNRKYRIKITIKKEDYYGILERPLIHQLGARIWGAGCEYETIEDNWFNMPKITLESEVSKVFSANELVIRYHKSYGQNAIYGVVTPHFVNMDQMEFRRTFYEQIPGISELKPMSNGLTTTKYGDVVEHFDFISPGFQTELKYGLVYAKNNGYDAYKAEWGQLILICSNGLKSWQGTGTNKWTHTKRVSIRDFIERTVMEGINHQRIIEDKINRKKEVNIDKAAFDELLHRLSLPQSIKERIIARLALEAQSLGDCEWALCQSLTYLGTHESAIQRWSRQKLVGLGTDILEDSLLGYLERDSYVEPDNRYGILLPRGFKTLH